MASPIAYDVLRLLLGPLAVTPRGIDRVDFRYARYFFETWRGDCVGTLPTPWGVRWYDRQRVLQGLDRLEQLWLETLRADEDHELGRIKGRLSGRYEPRNEKSGKDRGNILSLIPRLLDVMSLKDFSFCGSVVRSVPKNAIYINVGHVALTIPRILSWLQHRPDIKSVFMLHDVIPLEHPELVSSKSYRTHEKILDRTARYASGLIASTAVAREAVLNALCSRGRSKIPVETVPFPVAPVFLENDGPDQELRERDYFVVCGTIEARKNHLLLLNVWRELVRRRGQRAPKLVMVGSPGWGAGPVLRTLEHSRLLHGSVIFARGLSNLALRRLLARARALLIPSFAEGFGLPIIEALAVGTPVIASDLPAHREVAGGLAVYRDPTDAQGWLADICMFSDGTNAASEIRRRVAQYEPTTWDAYFTRIECFLETFEQR